VILKKDKVYVVIFLLGHPSHSILHHFIQLQVYAWCSCGYSSTQPLCDGSHKITYLPNPHKLRPVRYIPDKDMEVWLCNCKQTRNRPFCDGTHKLLREKTKDELLFED